MISHYQDLDRFIPSKSFQAFSASNSVIKKSQSFYASFLKQNICPSNRVLNYQNKQNFSNNKMNKQYKPKNYLNKSIQKQISPQQFYSNRKIERKNLLPCNQAEKILDIPGVKDDFYLNTLDWNRLGPLAVGLDNQAYMYTPSHITQVCKVLDGSYVSSVKFCDLTLSIGFSNGKIKIYDVETNSLIRQLNQHDKRVSTLCYSLDNLLYSGSKDRNILVSDLRLKDPSINKLSGHKGQICSLSCQPQSGNYIASGSNDNRVVIWDIRNHQMLRKYKQHKGAVKAVGWCPWKNGVIATAGGAGDKTIRLWNINQSQDLSCKKTETQISSLLWNEELGLLISSHGHPNNSINFWQIDVTANKAIIMQNVKTLKGHTGRILSLVMSPSQNMVCSLSADQTLRFWKYLDCEDPWKQRQRDITSRWSLKLK